MNYLSKKLGHHFKSKADNEDFVPLMAVRQELVCM
jgi:hypothetical protein